jgi:pyruvyl transferase EpsO
MSPYTRANVRQGILHYLLGRGMSGIAGIVAVILLVRYMDVEDYAAYTTLVSLIMMVRMLSGLGLERAATRYVPEGRLKHSSSLLVRFIWTTSLARIVVVALLTLLIGIFWQFLDDRVFGNVQIGAFTWAIACYLMASTLSQYLSLVLQAMVQQKALTRVLTVQWVGRLVLILVLVGTQSKITLDQALWIMAAPEMAGVVILAWVLRRHLSTLHHQQQVISSHTAVTHWPAWPEVRKMALHNYGYNLLAMPPQNYFMLMLAAVFLPVPFVAAYGFFLNLVERARSYLPLQLMYGLAEPVLIAGFVKDNDFDKLCSRTRFLFKANLLILAPVLVWLVAVGPEFTSLMTGGKYAEYAWLLFLIVAQIVVGSHAVTSQLILNAVGQSHILLKSGIVSLLAMTAALAIAVLSDHWLYMVFTPLVYSIANNAFIVLAFRRRGYAYTLPWKDMAKIAASAVVAYLTVLPAIAMTHSPLGELVVAVGTGLFVFLLALWLLGAVDIEDRKIVRTMLKSGSPA